MLPIASTSLWLGIVGILICQAFSSTIALHLEDMNFAVNPVEDFYEYANGGWLSAHPSPPAEYLSYGHIEEAREKTQNELKAIVEEESTKAPGQFQVGDMYASAMNEELISSVGLSPLLELQRRINAVNSASDLMRLTASLHQISLYSSEFVPHPCFILAAHFDANKFGRILLHLYQSGLAFPSPGYYVLEEYLELRSKYEEHLVRVFAALQASSTAAASADPVTAAKHVIYLETELAKASLIFFETWNPNGTYNKMSVFDLPGGLELWKPYFEAAALPLYDIGDVVIDSVCFFSRLSELVSDSSLLQHWNSYLHWHLVYSTSPFISKPFSELHFQLFERDLLGQQKPMPRWKRALNIIKQELGTPLGQIYVERHFSAAAKNQCLQLVELLKESLRDRIHELKWMSNSTKVKALQKLDALGVKVGFPDKWEDFSNVKVMRNLSFIENIWIGARARWAREIARINKPVDNERWIISPHTVNAFYDCRLNEIVFPAAILQPPFFFAPSDSNPMGDVSLSMGAIGTTIGHEMTHAFDFEGGKYGPNGNLEGWWAKEDEVSFAKKAQVIIEQFKKYQVEGYYISGMQTYGENIADLGGLKLAYTALKKFWSRSAGGEPALLDGFSTYQRFFLSYARIFRQTMTKEGAIQLLMFDSHAPMKYRVNGPLVHLREFREAFGAGKIHGVDEEDAFEVW